MPPDPLESSPAITARSGAEVDLGSGTATAAGAAGGAVAPRARPESQSDALPLSAPQNFKLYLVCSTLRGNPQSQVVLHIWAGTMGLRYPHPAETTAEHEAPHSRPQAAARGPHMRLGLAESLASACLTAVFTSWDAKSFSRCFKSSSTLPRMPRLISDPWLKLL